jgi:beta-lactamase class A
MTQFSTRRALLLALTAAPFARATSSVPVSAAAAAAAATATATATATARLAALEIESHGRLGVAAWNTADDSRIAHRGAERFPFCSTFKMMVAATVLARSVRDDALLGKRIRYTKDDLVPYAPVTGKHLEDGMTVAELCAAAIQYSDNPAANLLMKELGGPAGITAFARSIGDTEFRLDRRETELNTAIPGDPRDTTTPQAMLESLHKLVLGDALPPAQRAQLKDWMLGNTTGAERIRAGVPAGWPVADKTGSGDYGTVNDIGVIWPPGKAPILIAVYLTQPGKDDKGRSDVIAAASKIVVDAFTA